MLRFKVGISSDICSLNLLHQLVHHLGEFIYSIDAKSKTRFDEPVKTDNRLLNIHLCCFITAINT